MNRFHFSLKLLSAIPFRLVFDDPPVDTDDPPVDTDDPPDPDDTDPDPAKKKGGKKPDKNKVVLSPEVQELVNSQIAAERHKAKQATQKVITQLEAYKNRVGTTEAEKTALEQQIETLRNQHLTTEEMTKRERKKEADKHKKELQTVTEERDRWKNLFTESTIKREIVDAAVKHNAFNPEHIVASLFPQTRLTEELGEDGKPTGEYVPKAKLKTKDKDGKTQVLEFSVTEAVKQMKEMDDHSPLFNSGATGGTGSRVNNPRNKTDKPYSAENPPTDPAEYREWRKKNRIAPGR